MPRKIFELASELQIGAIELVEVLRAKGMSIRNHMATLEDDEVERALSLIKADSQTQEQADVEKKKVVKKKKVVAKSSEGQAASKKIVTIKKDSKAKDEVKFIRGTNCFCTHECFNTVNILFNTKFYPRLIKTAFMI